MAFWRTLSPGNRSWEATKAKPRMRRAMASDSSSGARSRPEIMGRQQKQSPECDAPWLQIAPLAYPLAGKQIVDRQQKEAQKARHDGCRYLLWRSLSPGNRMWGGRESGARDIRTHPKMLFFQQFVFCFSLHSGFRTCDRRLKESS